MPSWAIRPGDYCLKRSTRAGRVLGSSNSTFGRCRSNESVSQLAEKEPVRSWAAGNGISGTDSCLRMQFVAQNSQLVQVHLDVAEPTPADVKAAARFLGISRSLVYAYVERKQIPHYRIGRCIRFRLSELALWRQQFHVNGEIS